MLFPNRHYAIISSNAALRERYELHKQQYEDDYSIDLGRNIWSFPDNISHENLNNSRLKLKLMFMFEFYTLYLHEGTRGTPFGDLIQEICGEPPFIIDVFDRWWKLDIIFKIRSIEDYENWLSSAPDFGQLFARTGYSPTDEWIEQISLQSTLAEKPEDKDEEE